MKIQLLSDLHLEFQETEPAYFFTPCDVLILAGDIHVGREQVERALVKFAKIYPTIMYVPGNHEYYRGRLTDLNNLDVPNNVFVLNPGTVMYRNYLFVGATLWTDFRGDQYAKLAARRQINDFRIIKDFSVDLCQEIHKQEREYIVETCEQFEGYKKIVITHFLPSTSCIHPKYYGKDPLNKYFANDLDWWILNQKNTTWCFGHTHDKMDVVVGTTRLLCNPRGYPGENMGYNQHFTFEV